MPTFSKSQIVILPRAEEYRTLYDVSLDDVLSCLNAPDRHEGLATGHYTAEKDFPGHSIYIYYYLTLPLQYLQECYAIVDFIGYTDR
jgi:hypothetical protein